MLSSTARTSHPRDVEDPVLDVARMRADFPALAGRFTHLDGTGGTQVPRPVADAISRALLTPTSHHGNRHPAERVARDAMSAARSGIADLVGGKPEGVIFGRNMTELTFRMAGTLAKSWREGDEVVVSRLDHGANIAPWVSAAEQAGCQIRWVDFDPDCAEVTVDDVTRVLSDKTRLVAITAASNLTGTYVPIQEIASAVHAVGALLYVDGVHLTPHSFVDVAELQADFFVMGTHKLFGPHCSAVIAEPALLESLDPDRLPSAPHHLPDRFEVGTPPYEVLAGVAASIEYLAGLADYTMVNTSTADKGCPATATEPAFSHRRERLCLAMDLVGRHERRLAAHMEERFTSVPGLRRMSLARHRTPTEYVTMDRTTPEQLFMHLVANDIAASVGFFHAVEAARILGLGRDGGLRVGLVAYNTIDEVDLAASALSRCPR